MASDIKLHENPSSGSRVVTCGRTDMTKMIVALRNFTDAPKILPIAHKIYLRFFFMDLRTNDPYFNKSVFPKILPADPFWFRKIATDPHILAHRNTEGPNRYSKLKIFISEPK
jgi:hypothetical protein